jgi:DNA-binding winged helix-turn-helix (wHTH) protein
MFDEASFAIRQCRGVDSEPLAAMDFEDLLAAPERSAQPVFSFGPFRLLPTLQLLLKAGRRVHLGSRAFEILVALVERAGDVVSKAELIARVWPNMAVEESNLKVQVAGLRRALSDGRDGNQYLATIPGRGYRFVAPATLVEKSIPRARPTTERLERPAPRQRSAGRDSLNTWLGAQLTAVLQKAAIAEAIHHALMSSLRRRDRNPQAARPGWGNVELITLITLKIDQSPCNKLSLDP